jgi:hypothetical protein
MRYRHMGWYLQSSDQGSLVMVTVITAFSVIIKAVAADCVAECGGLLPRNSVFPIYSELHRTLSSRSKKWPMFAKIGWLLFRLTSLSLTSLSTVATNFNRTINLYGCQPWYLQGIRSFIAATATMNSYAASFDEIPSSIFQWQRLRIRRCARRRYSTIQDDGESDH